MQEQAGHDLTLTVKADGTLDLETTGSEPSSLGVLGGGSGDARNNFNLSKTGTGNFTLTGTNTYTGYTSVMGSTLTLSATANNIASSTVIDIETGATLDVSAVSNGCALGTGQTLSGVGSVSGALTINGQHQPGVGGTQTFASGVTYGAAAHHVWELLSNIIIGLGGWVRSIGGPSPTAW